MDFPYLRKVTQLNVAAIAAMARAPMPPEPVVEGAVSTDTRISWQGVEGAHGYIIRWRRTDSSQWSEERRADQCTIVVVDARDSQGRMAPMIPQCTTTLPHVRVDDWVFGVSSVAADGSESPVASAVPGGMFRPLPPPAPAAAARQ
jgi:hypothetical protein